MSVLSRIVCSSVRISYPRALNTYSKHFSIQNSSYYSKLRCQSARPTTCVLLPRYQSTDSETSKNQTVDGKQLTQRERLKQTFRDYGVTVVVFHVTIALTSLGISYLAVSNGVDVLSLLKNVEISEGALSSKIAVGGSTFVIAYAVHKLFAPFRMGITIFAAPFIVRYLRRINVLKAPKQK